jgi:hypothetical protein
MGNFGNQMQLWQPDELVKLLLAGLRTHDKHNTDDTSQCIIQPENDV